jgi:hypothetical protein
MNSGRLEIFHINAYFDFRFRVRQCPLSPGYLIFFSPKVTGPDKYFHFRQIPFNKGYV